MPDQINILMPDQKVFSIVARPEGMTIGRAPDNDIVIDHKSISRHHARIEFDGTRYQIYDLNSTNGTFLDHVRLIPDKAHTWLPGENLRVGEVWLRLERAEQSQTTSVTPLREADQQETKPHQPRAPGSETIKFEERFAMEKAREQGLEQGLEQGEKNKALKIARKLKEKGIHLDIICETTGLSKGMVKSL